MRFAVLGALVIMTIVLTSVMVMQYISKLI